MSAWSRLAEGDDQTWTDLINRLGPKVSDAIGWITTSKEDVADASSDVLLAVVQTLGEVLQERSAGHAK